MILLPDGFAALEPFVSQWSIEGSANRAALRGSSSHEHRAAFFDVGMPLLAPALAYLDAKPIADLDASDKRLMKLTLSLAHVSLAVEVQGDTESRHAAMRDRMIITRAPADRFSA